LSTENRILLINPLQIRPVVGPIAFDYLGYVLKEAGFAVDLVDHAFADLNAALAQYFSAHNPLAIGITVRNTDTCLYQGQAFFLDEIRELITHLNAIQSAPIILGGVGFSIAPAPIMEYVGAEFGVHGDGEAALPLFLKALQLNRDFTKIPNLLYRENNQFIMNAIQYVDLTTFHPPRDIIENGRYFDEGGQGNIETKRGCNRKCIYCADPICKGREIRLKDPKSVCAEFKALINQGVTCFHLCDSEFNNHMQHAKDICRAIIEEGLNNQMTWYTYCAPTPFDEELAGLMKAAGCVGINFGVDSGDDTMLHQLQRAHTVDQIARITEYCRAHSITIMHDLLIGGPGETKTSIKTSIEALKDIHPDRAGFSIGVRVYPKTQLARIIREEGAISKNPNLYGVKDNNPHFLKPLYYLSQEMGGNKIFAYIAQLVGNDPMWFFADPNAQEQNYNYNWNQVLVDAVKRGYRGAYWDILRKLSEE
jgi:radical SAM superfamily enzyme YgiQ (UPF0313 family)